MSGMPSLAPSATRDVLKKKRPNSPRGLCERFGLRAGELQRYAGEAFRSEAVFAAREVLMARYPRLFPTEDDVVAFITTADPNHRIVHEYKNQLKQHGWRRE